MKALPGADAKFRNLLGTQSSPAAQAGLGPLDCILAHKPCPAAHNLPPDVHLVGDDHRQAARQRLRHNDPEVLLVRGKHKDLRRREGPPFQRALQVSRPGNPVGDAEPRRHRFQFLPPSQLVGAHDHHLPRRVLAQRAQAPAADVVRAGERAPASDRPVERRGVERQRLLDLVEQVERIARLAVHLVDEGDDRDVAQPADLEQLAGARFDALGGVDHHHRRVDRGQGAVGVLGEIFVARGVEQVEDAGAVFEGHH